MEFKAHHHPKSGEYNRYDCETLPVLSADLRDKLKRSEIRFPVLE
jgi:hypothetical protein